MKIYLAGAENYLELIERQKYKNVLIAYPFFKKKEKEIRFSKLNIFLDSGAFSVFNKTKKIDIDKQIEDYKRWVEIKTKCGLDVIGDAEQTKINCMKFKDEGIDIIPTYHIGEDFDYLKFYLKNWDYVAIGGAVIFKNKTKYLKNQLNKCFAINKDMKRYHGFGINNWDIMSNYPFYSVDATSWHNPARWGQNFLMEKGKMKRIDHKQRTKFKVMDINNQIENSVLQFKKAEVYLTKLWEKRGIVWD